MPSTVLWLTCVGTLFSVSCDAEIEFYPGYRRPDRLAAWNKGIDGGYPYEDYAMQRLSENLKERERPQQQHEERNRPAFTYRFPDQLPLSSSKSSRPFAVDPSDPRYYLKTPIIPDYNSEIVDTTPDEEEDDDELTEDEYDAGTPAAAPKTPGAAGHTLHNGDLVRADRNGAVHIVPAHVSVEREKEAAGIYIIAMVAGISAAATVGLIAFGIGWYNLQKSAKAAADVEYPAYGVTGPHKDVSPSGDRRLAQSAHMYHYQHQKQQIIAMESRAANDRHGSMSEADSDEENEEGDYTVYECPGLAPTGEMEVKNPLFQDDPTPAPSTDKTPTDLTGTPDLK